MLACQLACRALTWFQQRLPNASKVQLRFSARSYKMKVAKTVCVLAALNKLCTFTLATQAQQLLVVLGR